jgi:hypothetical protein
MYIKVHNGSNGEICASYVMGELLLNSVSGSCSRQILLHFNLWQRPLGKFLLKYYLMILKCKIILANQLINFLHSALMVREPTFLLQLLV